MMKLDNCVVLSVGLNVRSIEKLNMTLNSMGESIVLVETATNPGVVLINFANADGAGRVDELFGRYPGVPFVGLTSRVLANESIHSISLPLDINELISCIHRLMPGSESTQTQSAQEKNTITDDRIARAMAAIDSMRVAEKLGNRKSEEANASSSTREINVVSDNLYFDSSIFLLGALESAIQQLADRDEVVFLNCRNSKMILVDRINHRIITDLSDSQIRNLVIAPLEPRCNFVTDLTFVDSVQLEKYGKARIGNARTFDLETFMWNLGVMTSKGRAPQSTSLSERVYLRRWPNISRLQQVKNGLRIIAYWARQPSSLEEISNTLNVPLADVLTVYTAATAAGLTGAAKRQADSLTTLNLNKNTERGIFNSFIGRLRKMYGEVA